ncbi:MAG: hypothetical protein HUJ71_10350 [Pseudobutyrivibrio sp.]|nr:hypothetical protein [Pseudobutyrivibrio sp.]
MDIVLCTDCEYFIVNQNETAGGKAFDYRCSNKMGLLNPVPNEFCSRGKRSKKSSGVALDQGTLDAIIAQRRK